MAKINKTYQYKSMVIEDRGFLNDPEFLQTLNEEGAKGWKHKTDQPMGSNRQVILLERELVLDGPTEASDG